MRTALALIILPSPLPGGLYDGHGPVPLVTLMLVQPTSIEELRLKPEEAGY